MKVELTEEELRLADPEACQGRYSQDTDEQPDCQSRVVLTPGEITNLIEEGEGSNEWISKIYNC